MKQRHSAPQVGAPDPELKTSPIFEWEASDDISPDLELERGVCYFNDVSYSLGQYVLSGDDLLHCEERGIWVRKREGDYD